MANRATQFGSISTKLDPFFVWKTQHHGKNQFAFDLPPFHLIKSEVWCHCRLADSLALWFWDFRSHSISSCVNHWKLVNYLRFGNRFPNRVQTHGPRSGQVLSTALGWLTISTAQVCLMLKWGRFISPNPQMKDLWVTFSAKVLV